MTATIGTKRGGEEGFTLLEILMAMIVLAVGGVSVLSLFASAVSLQYKSVVADREAKILPEVVARADSQRDAQRVPFQPDRRHHSLRQEYSGTTLWTLCCLQRLR